MKIVEVINDTGKILLDLISGDNFEVSKKGVLSLPKKLKQKESLFLFFRKVKKIQDDLTVNGSLYLSYNDIEELPKGLKIRGDLYISHTKIKIIPPDLKIGGNLILNNTMIENYPVIYNCGKEKIIMYLDYNDRTRIMITTNNYKPYFKGTKKEAIEYIKNTYNNSIEDYLDKIEQCFELNKKFKQVVTK